MRRLVLLVVTIGATCALAGGAAASAPGAQHVVVSNTWQGLTYVTGLDSCPVFGSRYVFDEVNLTDHISSTYSPYQDPLWRIESLGEVRGVIRTPAGTYTVAGSGLRENRVGALAPWYFSGTGRVVVSGPRGTVVGTATFQDLTGFPPPEFDLAFTGVTACRLR